MPPRHWLAGSSRRHLKGAYQPHSKYRAIPTELDGHRFASQREAAEYRSLKAQEAAGVIARFVCQPRFELQPKPHRITYVGDFLLTYPNGRQEVVECKGYETDVWKIKKKLYDAHQPPFPPLRIVR